MVAQPGRPLGTIGREMAVAIDITIHILKVYQRINPGDFLLNLDHPGGPLKLEKMTQWKLCKTRT